MSLLLYFRLHHAADQGQTGMRKEKAAQGGASSCFECRRQPDNTFQGPLRHEAWDSRAALNRAEARQARKDKQSTVHACRQTLHNALAA